jgi:hypothetical protein
MVQKTNEMFDNPDTCYLESIDIFGISSVRDLLFKGISIYDVGNVGKIFCHPRLDRGSILSP